MDRTVRKIRENEIPACVQVIRESFRTVAEEFGFTAENALRFTAFAMNEERLHWQFEQERRPMYACLEERKVVGYYSLLVLENSECELNNLCVLPAGSGISVKHFFWMPLKRQKNLAAEK